eukprot:g20978.t1
MGVQYKDGWGDEWVCTLPSDQPLLQVEDQREVSGPYADVWMAFPLPNKRLEVVLVMKKFCTIPSSREVSNRWILPLE